MSPWKGKKAAQSAEAADGDGLSSARRKRDVLLLLPNKFPALPGLIPPAPVSGALCGQKGLGRLAMSNHCVSIDRPKAEERQPARSRGRRIAHGVRSGRAWRRPRSCRSRESSRPNLSPLEPRPCSRMNAWVCGRTGRPDYKGSRDRGGHVRPGPGHICEVFWKGEVW